MILSVPVFYAAEVVLPGKRTQITALLAAQAHVRIPSPADFGLAVRVSRGFLDEIISERLRWDGASEEPDDIEEGYYSDSLEAEQLLAPLRFRSTRSYHRASQAISGSDLEAMGVRMVERGEQLGLLGNRNWWPFQSRDLLRSIDEDTPVFAETTSFRSMRPLVEDARNAALAYASRIAADLRADAAGAIYMPTSAPSLYVAGHRVLLDASRLSWWGNSNTGIRYRYRLDQASEALAQAALDESRKTPAMESFSAEVLRPAAYCWSPVLEVAAKLQADLMNPFNQVVADRAGAYQYSRVLRHRSAPITRAAHEVLGQGVPDERRLLDTCLEVLGLQRDMFVAAAAAHNARTVKGRMARCALAQVEHVLDMARRDPQPMWNRPRPPLGDRASPLQQTSSSLDAALNGGLPGMP